MSRRVLVSLAAAAVWVAAPATAQVGATAVLISPPPPYGVGVPGVFAMASAGSTGACCDVFSDDNRLSPPDDTHLHTGLGPQTASAHKFYAGTGGGAFEASGDASSVFGVLRLGSAMRVYHSDSVQPFLFLTGIADAGWADEITIDNPNFQQIVGSFQFGVEVKGNLHANHPRGEALFELGVASSTVGPKRETVRLDAPGPAGFDDDQDAAVNTTFFFDIPFQVGVPVQVMLRAITVAGLGATPATTSSSALLDFGHTINWGGIVSVTVGGVPLTNYTVTSASGTDWRGPIRPTAVPEPTTVALTAGGLAVAALAARRRRRA
jgi:hypothetical protein